MSNIDKITRGQLAMPASEDTGECYLCGKFVTDFSNYSGLWGLRLGYRLGEYYILSENDWNNEFFEDYKEHVVCVKCQSKVSRNILMEIG